MSNLFLGIILGIILHVNFPELDIRNITGRHPITEVSANENVKELEAAVKSVEASKDLDGKSEKVYQITFTYSTLENHEPVEFLQNILLGGMMRGDSTYGWDIENVESELE